MNCSVCNYTANSASDCECNFADSVYTRRLNDDCRDECGCGERLCCDCDGSCGCFENDRRDPFWPHFSRPRSLSCENLYRCRD